MGLFDKIFKKKKEFEPIDLSVLKTDVHSHFIPGIDDGAQSMEETLNLVKEIYRLGYRKIITTPHVMWDYYQNTTDILLRGRDQVREEVAKILPDMEIEVAAEYYLDEHFCELIAQKDLLTFGENYVLFELPFISEPPNFKEVIFDLLLAGYTPVLAHPERYGYWYDNKEMFLDIVDRGALLQININSLTSHYSKETQDAGKRMIDRDLVSFLGSDCHRMQHIDVIERARKEEYMHKLVNSGSLLNAKL